MVIVGAGANMQIANSLTIGKLASRSGVSAQTIRYYERNVSARVELLERINFAHQSGGAYSHESQNPYPR